MSRPLPTALFCADDRAGVLKHYGGLVPYARSHNLSYLLINDADFRQEMTDENRAQLEKSIRFDPGLEKVWEKRLGCNLSHWLPEPASAPVTHWKLGTTLWPPQHLQARLSMSRSLISEPENAAAI